MIHAIAGLSPAAILVVSILGFGLGALWYSPFMFAKAWKEEMRAAPGAAGEGAGRFPLIMAGAVLLTVVSTFTLGALLSAHHTTGALRGAGLGLMVAVGLVAAREGTNALFEGRTLRHYLVTAGHDAFVLAVQGAVLAVWR